MRLYLQLCSSIRWNRCSLSPLRDKIQLYWQRCKHSKISVLSRKPVIYSALHNHLLLRTKPAITSSMNHVSKHVVSCVFILHSYGFENGNVHLLLWVCLNTKPIATFLKHTHHLTYFKMSALSWVHILKVLSCAFLCFSKCADRYICTGISIYIRLQKFVNL